MRGGRLSAVLNVLAALKCSHRAASGNACQPCYIAIAVLAVNDGAK